MGRLPQAGRSKQAHGVLFHVYVCMHMYGEMLGLARLPAPGRLLSQFIYAACFLIYMYVCTYREILGLSQAAHTQASCLPVPFMYVCMYMYREMRGLSSPPQAG